MKQRVMMIVLVLALVLSAQGCQGFSRVRGSGKVVEEERSVSDFAGVSMAGMGNLYIELGDKEELRIEAEDNLMQYLESEVRSGTLHLEQQDGVSLWPREPINFFLTVKRLDSITVAGSGDVEAPDLSAARFSVSISGSGDVEMGDLNTDALKVTITGSGEVDIAGGEVREQDVRISGSGNYRARDMESAQAEVSIAGSGDVVVRVSDHLEVDIGGSGDVRYAGSPTVDSSVDGSGDITRIGD